jgi:ATP-dependent Lon protease
MENKIKESLYLLPLEDAVMFPDVKTKIKIDKDMGVLLEILKKSGPVFLLALTVKNNATSPYQSENQFYSVGNLVRLETLQQSVDGYIAVLHSLEEVEVINLKHNNDQLSAEYLPLVIVNDLDEKSHSEMISFIRKTITDLSRNFTGADLFLKPLMQVNSIEQIIGTVLPYIPVNVKEKQELLEMLSLREKSLKFIDLLLKQKESISMQLEMARKFSSKNNSTYRRMMLQEQLKSIQDELKETDDIDSGKEEGYSEKIERAGMPEKVKKIALAELKKLDNQGSSNPESSIIRNYLDLLTDLPWGTVLPEIVEMDKAREILDLRHYGLKDVKERILQHLAVMKIKKEKQGSILLLVGPPGTGKTSLGKSIAEALNRKYSRISLGGIRDEAEIRGHRRTYIGALPGRIIQAIRRSGVKNPVFVLDEIDKISASYAGDPSSALLEVLDPEQNNSFTDHYLEVPYDLSDVFFIATANSLSNIPAPLLDRTEIIQISSYTSREKFVIARDHLMPEILDEHGITTDQLQVEDGTIEGIIDEHTREAGVRGLKKQLAKIARVASEKIVSGKEELPFVVNRDKLNDVLGRKIARLNDIQKDSVPGVVTGLAWTPVGGDILFIEGTFMGGKGSMTLTGQLGDVMKESARISLSLIRSRLAHVVGQFDFIKNDIHIHVPSGATPKDGPSAGVGLFTALASLILGKPVDPGTAMTGEITLRGAVLPVGGIKEKVLAAHRAGVKKIILPLENEKDLEDLPPEVRNELNFIKVETVEEVLKETLYIDLPGPAVLFSQMGIDPVAGLDSV